MVESELKEGDVRVSIGEHLIDAWTSGNCEGYSPNWDTSNNKHIRLQRGNYNQDYGVPQLGLIDVSSERISQSWKADGSGMVDHYDGRVDVNAYVGSEDELPEDTQLLAFQIGQEVRDIVQATPRLIDAHTSGQLTTTIEPLSKPVVTADTDGPEARYLARVELGYRTDEQPPNR